MPTSYSPDALSAAEKTSVIREEHIELGFIGTLQKLKYEYRPDITDRATLEQNFREKFEALNRVNLTEGEFARLLDEIITPDVFAAAKTLRAINAFTHGDGTPLNYTLVNIKDWCKNTYEVINQLCINTDNSHHQGKAEVRMKMREGNQNHQGRKRPQRSDQTVRAANHSLVRKPAEIDGSSGAGQTTAPLGNLGRSKLLGSPSRTEQSRVHRQMRRLPSRTGGAERSETDWLTSQPAGAALRELNPAKKPSFDALAFTLRAASRQSVSLRSATAGNPPTPWAMTCASRTTASPPSPPPTSPSCCSASTSSKTKA